MKIFLLTKNCGDGSINIGLYPTKEGALEYLERTEEEIESGSPYDDGTLKEIEFDPKLPFLINVDV